MRVFSIMLAGFLIGGGLTFAIGMTLPEIMPIAQREGGYAMAVAFFYTPAGAVLGAIAGLIRALRKR